MKEDILMDLIILLSKAEAEVENKPEYDEDYDYNVGFEDGLQTAINTVREYFHL